MSSAISIRERLERLLAQQAEHPAYPRIDFLHYDSASFQAVVRIGAHQHVVDVEEVAKLHEQRERRIVKEKEDRFRFTYEPDMWRETDIRVARKRLEYPGVQLELLCMGGIRSGKTDFVTCRVVRHFFYTEKAWVWGLHETEQSSKTIQQKRVMEFYPPEMNPTSGKYRRDRKTKVNYTDGGGFTGNLFNLVWQCQDEAGHKLEGGGLFDFKFYKSADSTLQGAELTCATSDELVPLRTVDTVRERLLSRAAETRHPTFLARVRKALELLEAGEDVPLPLYAAIYHGVHLISFTPKEGWSPTVQDFLDSAITISEVPAELLPHNKKVPRFKQPKKPTRLVAYFHTYDNVFKGNWPGMVAQCVGVSETYIRVIAYGDVSKGWAVRFPKFRDVVHVVNPRSQIPRKGTWYHICDPAGNRNWFMIWALCDELGRLWIVREWPQEGDFIPDVGDPGAWAVTSELGNRNGDRGPAQDGLGWGFNRYKREIERIEAEIGAWWNVTASAAGGGCDPRQLCDRQQLDGPVNEATGGPVAQDSTAGLSTPIDSKTGGPIVVRERQMDSRLGSAPTPAHGASTTIMDGMEAEGMPFEPASGDRLKEGDAKINDLLDYNDSKPVGPLNSPRLFVGEECKAVIFMFQNYGDPVKPHDDACKDPRDVTAYMAMGDLLYLEGVNALPWGGGSY